MLNFIRILCFSLCFLAAPVMAQTSAPAKSVTVSETSLKSLIKTLESDSARSELLDNLKTLLKQKDDEQVEDSIAPLTETLGVESFTESIIKKYQNFLSRYNLSGSTVGKLSLTVGASLFTFILIFLFRRLATRAIILIDRAMGAISLPPASLRLYARTLRFLVTVTLIGLLIYGYFIIWGVSQNNPFDIPLVQMALKSLANIAFILMLGAFLWEILNISVQLVLRRLGGDGSARTQTIIPIIRKVLFIAFVLLLGLMVLSELGINIMPLLAGAGILGVAIGFGAQTMVKDFLSGFTIILEDVIRVGDVAKMAGHSGVVEKITLRKIQMRDYSGTVYTIPFSEITTIENLTKDFSFYEMNVGVSYSANTDQVCEVMRKVDEDMRADSTYKNDMLEPIDIAGVDQFADSAVIIKARLKTVPIRQWVIGREYNRRLKIAFDAAGIEIPFPQRVVTTIMHEKKDAS